jgi:hypothetical protein
MLLMTQKHIIQLLFVVACLAVVVACQPQPPILVYVTPTPQSAATVETTLEVTVDGSITPSLTPTAVSTVQSGTVAPTPTFIGSVIGPEYTLPPTSTPRPTETPPPSETPAPGITPPTATSAPSETPSGPTPTPLPNLDASRMGIQLDPTLNQDDWNQAISDIQRLGVKWLKVQVAWSLLEQQKGQISEDFRRLEIYLETADSAGLDILISIAKAPAWSRPGKPEDGPPDNPQDLADFILLFLSEVGKGVDAVEIWNEPNLSREWGGQELSGASYMRYFVPAYNAVQQYLDAARNDPVEPRTKPMTVITAGLAPTQGDGAADDRVYLQQMYNAGLAQYTGENVAVGVHPYGWANPPDATCCGTRGWDDNPRFFFLDTINDYREIMTNSGDTDAKMWLTEVGWATWAGLPGEPPEPWIGFTDECQQGNYLVRAFQMSQERDFIGPFMLWNLNFAILSGMVESRDERAAYSLIVPLEPRERAAYWMLFDAIRPEIPQLDSYSRCPGAG